VPTSEKAAICLEKNAVHCSSASVDICPNPPKSVGVNVGFNAKGGTHG